jgi:hypothetical protein
MTDQVLDLPTSAEGGFRIGDVFSRSFSVFGRRFLPFVATTAVITSPILLLPLLNGLAGPRNVAPGKPDTRLEVVGFAVTFLTFALQYLAQAVVLSAAFQDMRGRANKLRDSAWIGITRLLPLAGTLIVTWLAIGLCWIVLAFPGIMVFTMTAVVIPVCVIEKRGPFASMSRSTELTKGNRWRILAIYLVSTLVTLLVSVTFSVLIVDLVGPWLGVFTSFVVSAVITTFTSILNTVVYHDLRVAKEGLDTDSIAAVFD